MLNRVPPAGTSPQVQERLEAAGLPLVGNIPLDHELLEASMAGRSLLELPDANPTYSTLKEILAQELGAPAAAR